MEVISIHDRIIGKRKETHVGHLMLFLLILTGALLLRLSFSVYAGNTYDMNINEGWMKSALELGIGHSFGEQVDGNMLPNHLPLEIFLYGLSGMTYQSLVSMDDFSIQPSFRIFTKLPAILFDLVACIGLFFLVQKMKSTGAGLLAAVLYAIQPVVWYESAVWGQTDGIYSALFLLCITMLAYQKVGWASAFLALAILHKPQALVLIPLLLFFFPRSLKSALSLLVGGGLAALYVLFPFYRAGTAFRAIDLWWEALFRATNFKLSRGAFTFWDAIIGNRAFELSGSDMILWGITYRMVGTSLVLCAYLLVFYAMFRHRNKVLSIEVQCAACALISLAFFLFATGVHDRYLFPFVLFGLPLSFRDRRGFVLYMSIALLFFVNIFWVLPITPAAGSFLYKNFPLLHVTIATLQVVLCGCYFHYFFTLNSERVPVLDSKRR